MRDSRFLKIVNRENHSVNRDRMKDVVSLLWILLYSNIAYIIINIMSFCAMPCRESGSLQSRIGLRGRGEERRVQREWKGYRTQRKGNGR